MEGLFFYLFGGGALLSAILTITRRDAITSAFWLIFSFLCLAGLFALLSAHFLAVLQILLYAGAIMVFFLFVIMLLGKDLRPRKAGNRLTFFLGLAGIAALGTFLSRFATATQAPFPPVAASYGGIERVSDLLLTKHLFAFELVGLLLTVAVIGAVHLARREAEGGRAARSILLRSEELRHEREAQAAALRALGAADEQGHGGADHETVPTAGGHHA